jgi:hypothetical protein
MRGRGLFGVIDLFGRHRPARQRGPEAVPPSAARVAPPPAGPRQPMAAEALAAARAEGRAEALAHYADVVAMCAVAERPDLIKGFLAAALPIKAVRAALITARAEASPIEINGQRGPMPEAEAVWGRAVAKANRDSGPIAARPEGESMWGQAVAEANRGSGFRH